MTRLAVRVSGAVVRWRELLTALPLRGRIMGRFFALNVHFYGQGCIRKE